MKNERDTPPLCRTDDGTELVYTTDAAPGFTRTRHGDGFRYRDTNGKPLTNPAHLSRIRSLAIPPAYERVWICPLPEGHLQATGRDARGRKQYRYHPQWRAVQETTKFERLAAFGRALPRIRARVKRDLDSAAARPGVLTRGAVLATIVRLLDTTYARVGNDEYARTNGSYGLTTLRNRHVRVRAGMLALSFRGKSGVAHRLSVSDPKVIAVVRRCQQLPGQALFQYIDEAGDTHGIDSSDVNAYLADATSHDTNDDRFTAKDFRTWHASVQALALTTALGDAEAAEAGGQRAAKRRVQALVAEVAQLLGNTVTVCRKSYIHPAVLAYALTTALTTELTTAPTRDAAQRPTLPTPADSPRELRVAERRLLAFLDTDPSVTAAS